MSIPEREHPVAIDGYPGDLSALGTSIGRLRYDALAVVLDHLAVELARQARADSDRGREQLSARLQTLTVDVRQAAADTRSAWALCRRHVASELAQHPELPGK